MSKLATQTFVRTPMIINAIQVTSENIQEVAEWCDGDVLVGRKEARYIHVRVTHPRSERQTQAYVGDWVLYAGKGYKVYTNNAFHETFVPYVATEEKTPELV